MSGFPDGGGDGDRDPVRARPCAVCGAAARPPGAVYGFGPPLPTPRGATLWACAAHRAEVDRALAPAAAAATPAEQGRRPAGAPPRRSPGGGHGRGPRGEGGGGKGSALL